ncbi:MAG: hypothetical protein KKA19_01585 [Candidatus Margulisbacteria bacterium]|nr:hypothetical protein [Candidatus Margulisiibacteriota bacterium]
MNRKIISVSTNKIRPTLIKEFEKLYKIFVEFVPEGFPLGMLSQIMPDNMYTDFVKQTGIDRSATYYCLVIQFLIDKVRDNSYDNIFKNYFNSLEFFSKNSNEQTKEFVIYIKNKVEKSDFKYGVKEKYIFDTWAHYNSIKSVAELSDKSLSMLDLLIKNRSWNFNWTIRDLQKITPSEIVIMNSKLWWHVLEKALSTRFLKVGLHHILEEYLPTKKRNLFCDMVHDGSAYYPSYIQFDVRQGNIYALYEEHHTTEFDQGLINYIDELEEYANLEW